ncbi:MAG: thiamine pyrophosphate-binding protein [Chloroflexi bacterium]|nr:thiamine pyrophosphate-binding protein [Chloroflexota bacterium]
MITYEAFMQVLAKHRGNAIVLPTMTANTHWNNASKSKSRDLPTGGAMSKTSSIALGLALSQPNTKVIVLDGDGSLLMNLGSLATVAGKHPKNLVHFVMNNGVYSITGGQPIAADGIVDFSVMAKGAGYAAAFTFDDLEEFAVKAAEVFKTEGPVFVTIKTVPENQNEPIGRRRRDPNARTALQTVNDMRKELGSL